MSLNILSISEKEVVLECLKAVAFGPFISERYFHTLFGIELNDLKGILEQWPQINESELDTKLAINNSMLNLWGYPHECEKEWDKWISVTPDEVYSILNKWKEDIDWSNT